MSNEWPKRMIVWKDREGFHLGREYDDSIPLRAGETIVLVYPEDAAVPTPMEKAPLRADEPIEEQMLRWSYVSGWNACLANMKAAAPEPAACQRCKGAGSLEVDSPANGQDVDRVDVACPDCGGTGALKPAACPFGCETQEEHDKHSVAPPSIEEAKRQERERCAKVCESLQVNRPSDPVANFHDGGCARSAAAIRALGDE